MYNEKYKYFWLIWKDNDKSKIIFKRTLLKKKKNPYKFVKLSKNISYIDDTIYIINIPNENNEVYQKQ